MQQGCLFIAVLYSDMTLC